MTLVITILTGCNLDKKTLNGELEDFSTFTNRIFTTEVQQDTITLNYSLANPKSYGITKPDATLGHFSVDYINKSLVRSENYLSTLKKYDYNTLTDEEQLTYDILKRDLELELKLGDFILYTESLGPTTGIQAQLPILLAEYNFYSKEDIDTYLLLLPQVYHYFEEIITFEKEKSKAGLFMSDKVADNIISQCNSFISHKEDNYLIDIFNDTMDNFPDLTDKEREEYKAANKEAVLKHIIPAYEMLINELTNLKGTGTNSMGLSYYDKGKEYYEYLIAVNTGSSKSVEQLKKMLEESITENMLKLSTIMAGDTSVYEKALSPNFKLTEPSKIIEYLKVAIEKDFPKAPDVNYNIKYVHESLQEHLSPAMYLIPAIDNYKNNIIYIR